MKKTTFDFTYWRDFFPLVKKTLSLLSRFILDDTALVYVKGIKAPSTSKTDALTPLEVVKQATHLQGYNDLIAETDWVNGWHGKDTISSEPALLRLADDIIYDHTGYNDYIIETSFIYSYDMVILRGTIPNYDTIAYIPNSLVEAAREAILLAFENEDTGKLFTPFLKICLNLFR